MSMRLDDQEDFLSAAYVCQFSQSKAEYVALPQSKESLRDIWVKLMVGGKYFETTKSTLLRGGESMFTAWLSWPNVSQRKEIELRIDRDGERFAHVLNYLRNGTVWLDDIPGLRGVREEAVYYGFISLQQECDELIQEIEAKEDEAKDITRLQEENSIAAVTRSTPV